MTESQLQLITLQSLEDALCSCQEEEILYFKKAFIYHKNDTGYPADQLCSSPRVKETGQIVSKYQGKEGHNSFRVSVQPTGQRQQNSSIEMRAKQRWGLSGGRIQGTLISQFDNGCALTRGKKTSVNYERHLSDIRKIPVLRRKHAIIYQRLDAMMYFSLCNMETHVDEWVAFWFASKLTLFLRVLGFSQLPNGLCWSQS